jgi:hypothetical protein
LNKFSRQNAAFGAEAFRTLQSSRASWRIRRTTWHPEQPEHAWTKFNRSTASSQWLRSLTGHHENDQNESPSSRLQWGCCGGYWRKFQLIFLCYIYFHIYIYHIFSYWFEFESYFCMISTLFFANWVTCDGAHCAHCDPNSPRPHVLRPDREESGAAGSWSSASAQRVSQHLTMTELQHAAWLFLTMTLQYYIII